MSPPGAYHNDKCIMINPPGAYNNGGVNENLTPVEHFRKIHEIEKKIGQLSGSYYW